MEESIIEQNIEQPIDTQPTENGPQSGNGKMFTQEEVNEIIKTRLERERKKLEPKEPTEAELREKELAARTAKLDCREYVTNYGYPSEFLDIIDTSNVNDFKKNADAVYSLIQKEIRRAGLAIQEPMASTEPSGLNPASGFERTRKHTPKSYSSVPSKFD